MSDTTAVVTYPINFAKELPERPDPEIVREGFLATLDRLLQEHEVVFLEGDEGSGTSTTAAQFCRHRADSSLALFIKPASRMAYSADYVRLVLAEQIHFLLYGKRFPSETVTPADYSTLMQRLRSRANKANYIYFVIDGLHQIPEDDNSAINTILRDLLPFGWPNFRFLIVGNQEIFTPILGKGLSPKSFYQQLFEPRDTNAFLAACALDEGTLKNFHRMCGGFPQKLAVVRRLLEHGATPDSILDAEPSQSVQFIN